MKSISHISSTVFLFLFAMISTACVDLVEEGIEVQYGLSDAELSVVSIAGESAAADETVSFKITVNSEVDIKSCIIESTNPGQNGSGFNVSTSEFDDPFIDHIFGTIQKNTRSFTVRYDYLIPEGINKSRLTFTIVDESGKVSTERTVEVVPGIVSYPSQELYAADRDFHDAFASAEGVVYPDIKTNYSTLSAENVAVQEKIDLIFYYDQNARRTTLAAPASGRLGLELSIENATLFKKLPELNELNLQDVTPASLIELTAEASLLSEGSLQVDNFVVGDVIGFITDLNATYALKTGLLKVTGLHPASVDRYPGLSYVLECDIIVQQ
jgi:hypothetical protein